MNVPRHSASDYGTLTGFTFTITPVRARAPLETLRIEQRPDDQSAGYDGGRRTDPLVITLVLVFGALLTHFVFRRHPLG